MLPGVVYVLFESIPGDAPDCEGLVLSVGREHNSKSSNCGQEHDNTVHQVVQYMHQKHNSETGRLTVEPDMGPKPPLLLLLSPVNLLTAFLAELLTELAADPTVDVKF